MNREEWRPVAGYEGTYEVSNRGRVRSLDRVVVYIDGMKRSHRGRILSPHHYADGSIKVQLYSRGVRQHVEVDTLVAEAFTPVKDVVDWSQGNRTVVRTRDDALKLLSTAEQAVAWYRSQLAAMTLAYEQLKAEMSEPTLKAA